MTTTIEVTPAAPEPNGHHPRPAGPLAGLRVLEMGSLVAGPFCTRLLGEFGAEVIKIEPPGQGDQLRRWGLRPPGSEDSLWWYVQGRNKKSLTLNLKKRRGQELARRLAMRCDVVVENFRPGKMAEWGLDYERLAADNPGLVYVSISGFGQSGPYRDRVGFGSIAESMGGLRYLTGYPDRPPTRVGLSIGDSLAGIYAALGALMALHHRDHNGGRGQLVDIALYEAVFSLLESSVPEFDRLNVVRQRKGTRLSSTAPSNTYTTRDNHSVVIGANNDAIFRRFCKAMGRADLADDPREPVQLRGARSVSARACTRSGLGSSEAALVALRARGGCPVADLRAQDGQADDLAHGQVGSGWATARVGLVVGRRRRVVAGWAGGLGTHATLLLICTAGLM
ncbi:MAG: CoA transferase [Chloroflexi bacterium]|nr:MAG: CoA transferase [Chloroflexota bacterium]